MENWNFSDYQKGLCDLHMVNTPKQIEPETPSNSIADIPNNQNYQPMTRAERKVKLQAVADKIIHYAHDHPEAMLDDNASNLNKLLDLFAKMDEREEEKPALGKLTDADLANMSITDLKRVLIDIVMNLVPADKQADALQTLRR